MRKTICFILASVLILSSCNRLSNTTGGEIVSFDAVVPSNNDYLGTLDVPYKQADNYEIFTNEAHSAYYYIIKSDNQDIIDIGYHNQRGSFDVFFRDNLLVLDYGWGGNSWHERYYDVSIGRVSRFFPRPISTANEFVAYFMITSSGHIALVVQNMFDPSEYYREFERNFSDFVFKDLAAAEFISQNTQLKISYWTTPNDEVVTEIINL